ncbi:MAG TPA: CoA-binding protein [Candidatus Binatia bacterium]|nr:CoA-binding protein [Candidatus Binatia bacterium]
MYEFLKKIPLFAAMPDDDFERLCEIAEEVRLPAGSQLFAEGSPGMRAYVIMEGEVEIVKKSGNREVLLAIRPAGEVIGEMALLEQAPRMASVRAHTDAVLLAIHHDELNKLLDNSPSAARAMLTTMVGRLRNTEAMLRESDKMAQLGTLSAGVAHELNNPAAAVQRGAGQLQEANARLAQAREKVMSLRLTPKQQARISDLLQETRSSPPQKPDLGALERSDHEYEMETWLEEKQVPDAWEFTSALVDLGFDVQKLDALHAELQSESGDGNGATGPALALVAAQYSVERLLAEVAHGAARIAEIVKALKAYSYLDQAPVQEVDVREGLENTLIILRDKLKGIEIERQFDPKLPSIQAYGSELNQVFTNILDNAAYALKDQGDARIAIRARQEDDVLLVEIEDNGPGIPPDIVNRVFDAFYTTKAPGEGTGLGLNISYNIVVHRHRGDLSVHSEPGSTCFTIKLPIRAEEETAPARGAQSSGGSVLSGNGAAGQQATRDRAAEDATLKKILETTRTIAVVGMSSDPKKPAHTVPLYLRDQGYEIMPVNPRGGWLVGLRVYRDLLSLPKVPDVVLIFRPSSEVPDIVEQAIQIAARVIWMNLGIRHEEAAARAHAAGLDVVMDACMRTAHKRLFS